MDLALGWPWCDILALHVQIHAAMLPSMPGLTAPRRAFSKEEHPCSRVLTLDRTSRLNNLIRALFALVD
jgi:hypothetical protein